MPQTGSLCHARLTDTDQVLAYCVAFSYSELIETSSLRHFKATGPFYLRGRTVDSSSLQGALTCSHRHIEDSKRIRHPGASGTSLKTSVLLATPFTLVSCSGISLRMMSGAKKKPWLTRYALHSELPIDRQRIPTAASKLFAD